jgi:hypothetical protein
MRKMREAICLFLVLSLCSVVIVGPSYGEAGNESEVEYRIKAAFILNFAKFVSWPENPGEDMGAPIIMCVAGHNHFGDALESIRGKKVHDRILEIFHMSDTEEIPPCHVLFMGKGMEDCEGDMLGQVRSRPVLTIGETRGFAERGGMINFIMVDNRVRFEINPIAVENASLRMSSQLLKLAVIVKTENDVEN